MHKWTTHKPILTKMFLTCDQIHSSKKKISSTNYDIKCTNFALMQYSVCKVINSFMDMLKMFAALVLTLELIILSFSLRWHYAAGQRSPMCSRDWLWTPETVCHSARLVIVAVLNNCISQCFWILPAASKGLVCVSKNTCSLPTGCPEDCYCQMNKITCI